MKKSVFMLGAVLSLLASAGIVPVAPTGGKEYIAEGG